MPSCCANTAVSREGVPLITAQAFAFALVSCSRPEGMTKMENEKDISAQNTMQFLTDLAAATTRYYEARPDDSERSRVEYELALTRFRGSLPTGTESPVR